MLRPLSIAALLALASACASSKYDGEPFGELTDASLAPLHDASELDPDLAPVPYTPEELRAALSNGYRVFDLTGDEEYARMRFHYYDSDELGTGLEELYDDFEGNTGFDAFQLRYTWDDLVRYEAFDAEGTTISMGRAHTAAGSFDCWVYMYAEPAFDFDTLEDPDALDDPDVLAELEELYTYEYYYAVDLPGPPVLALERDSSGTIVYSVALSSYSPEL